MALDHALAVATGFFRISPRHGSGNTAGDEWIASSNISVEDFRNHDRGLLHRLAVFVADEKCSAPSNLGTEDYSGPLAAASASTLPPVRLSCDTPLAVGEDFSGEVCTQVAPSIVTPDQGQTFSAKHQHNKADVNDIVANEIQIRLDLFTPAPAPPSPWLPGSKHSDPRRLPCSGR